MRWRDLDALGHVNAMVFLSYLEEGRNAWLREVLGVSFGPEQYVFARVEVDYRAEIPMGTEYVQTDHEIESLGRSSVVFSERLLGPNGAVVAEARVVLVMWNPLTHRPRPISTGERERLTGMAIAPQPVSPRRSATGKKKLSVSRRLAIRFERS